MAIRERRRPRWLPWLGALVATAGFCALGIWQIQRAGDKEQLVDSLKDATRPPLAQVPEGRAALQTRAYRRVRLQGRFLGKRQFLLTNRTLQGRVGADVLTPFVLADDRIVLVDRGWVAMRPDEAPPTSVAFGEAAPKELTGRLWLPDPGAGVVAAMAPGQDWPRRLVRVDFDAMSSALGRPLVPAIIRVDSRAAWSYQPRDLRPEMGPMRHYGYAFQWFMLAATVLVVAFFLEWRRQRCKE